MATEERVMVGAVAGARGLRGEVRIKSFTTEPAALGDYGPLTNADGSKQYEVALTGTAKGLLIARIKGVDSREAAEALKGTELYAARSQMPAPEEDEFYHADLVGLPVEDVEGAAIGTVRRLDDFGAGDVMEIILENGKSLVVPFTRAAVPVIDLEAGKVVVDPPPGLMDQGEAPDDGRADGRDDGDGEGVKDNE